jgi:hypothetical protein
MDPREGCFPLDIGWPIHTYWPDMNLLVRISELVRRNLHSIDPRIPWNFNAWLMCGVTAHSGGEYPMIAVTLGPDSTSDYNPNITSSAIEYWLTTRKAEIVHLIKDITSPSWEELQVERYYPRLD